MVLFNVKKEDKSLFLFEAKAVSPVDVVIESIVEIYNSCLKIQRICSEIEELSNYGVYKPLQEKKTENEDDSGLSQDFEDLHLPKGGFEENKDLNGKRIGRRPKEDMRDVLLKVIAEARGTITVELVPTGICLTPNYIQDALCMLDGALRVVYPSGLPSHDPIAAEMRNEESLEEHQRKQVLAPATAELWFATKSLQRGKKLSDYFGKNDKSKVVVKLQSAGYGVPTREPLMNEEQKKELIMAEFKRRQENKKLEEDEDDTYLNSQWADNHHLKKAFHGVTEVKWKTH